mmetsp:Transcript_40220/g.76897  ORF Transcript_40220/g.76897 Transcript_40220/m.76897 type:complete len:104 (-) Transcript_40220:177-488(-)
MMPPTLTLKRKPRHNSSGGETLQPESKECALGLRGRGNNYHKHTCNIRSLHCGCFQSEHKQGRRLGFAGTSTELPQRGFHNIDTDPTLDLRFYVPTPMACSVS